MTRLGWLIFLFLASSAGVAVAAPDYSGTWEIGVREFGGTNYYLPMQDGRLVLEASGDSYKGRFNQITFSGSLQKDGLHLSCNEQGRDCGQHRQHDQNSRACPHEPMPEECPAHSRASRQRGSGASMIDDNVRHGYPG